MWLLDEKRIQVDTTRNVVANYFTLTSLTSAGPIEFHIPGTVDEYIDLNDIQLLVRMKITKNDGKSFHSTDKVAFINQPFSCLCRDGFVTIGNEQVEGSQHCNPYNAYLTSLLQFHAFTKSLMHPWG